MYIMTPDLKTSRRLLLWNIVRYTFPSKDVFLQNIRLSKMLQWFFSNDKEINRKSPAQIGKKAQIFLCLNFIC